MDSLESYYEYKNTTFRERIVGKNFPKKVRCSRCGDGIMKLREKEFHFHETGESIEFRAHDDWEPDWISYIFSGVIDCQNCGATYSVSGTGHIEEQWDEYEGQIYYDVFNPHFFIPTINLFVIPKCTPVKVKESIESAFSLAWADYSASGNKLRVALEHIISEFSTCSDKSLGNKINELPEDMEHVNEILNAIKWLGNQSSHEAKLEECDLAFAFKAIEQVLHFLYPDESESEKLLSHARLINKKKRSIID
ncbi:DUF4145 domain-containing protein [Vibrio alginolyticus]|uniref:DUF4145 domain-containing protein n=1 Tax=Vibrio alginolyticus TaxID=663 RepID=UPI00215C38A4|nr:DUF4145 domain-containing protein [Vibrio alginolyticus]MCR9395764.1 DUF4145 domain-containing protein [Vibrio alginolyticus]